MCNAEPFTRPLGGTEHAWCRAVASGTGVTVLSFLFSKPPNLRILRNALQKIQTSQPILSSKLHFDPSNNSFSFITPPTPSLHIRSFDLESTSEILQSTSPSSPDHFHSIIEHELNNNTWQDHDEEHDVLFAGVYDLPGEKWAVVLRLHTAVCDRTAGAAIMREVGWVMLGGIEVELGEKGVVNLGIEEMAPVGIGKKGFLIRGFDIIGYSMNSMRLSNLNFGDVGSPRSSQLLRLKINAAQTAKLLAECETRDINICSALAAAAMVAAHSLKQFSDHQWEKYAVVTLVDCRSLLHPSLTSNDLGFYHSAIVNTHDVKGDEEVWDLAKRIHTSFTNSNKNNKHFSDMNDLNFLMCKAIENPGLTPSSTSRTAFISVWEDSLTEVSNNCLHQEVGLEDFVGCSSAHGVGPSIALFDAIQNGHLDCACVYPSPLHSREQMEELLNTMKRILIYPQLEQ